VVCSMCDNNDGRGLLWFAAAACGMRDNNTYSVLCMSFLLECYSSFTRHVCSAHCSGHSVLSGMQREDAPVVNRAALHCYGNRGVSCYAYF
jgi:hypothetical protein